MRCSLAISTSTRSDQPTSTQATRHHMPNQPHPSPSYHSLTLCSPTSHAHPRVCVPVVQCPNEQEMQKELVNKLKNLYKFDCLRANKSTAAWGVEARVPFLDRKFLDYVMNDIPAADKMCGLNGQGRIEKHILREAFRGYLSEGILGRQKEQFSDGVGYGWIDALKERAESSVSDLDYANRQYRFPINTPATKEAYYIRSIFDRHFPHSSAALCVPGGPSVACSTAAAIAWDESFRQMADCSGRSVAGVHEHAYDEQRRKDESSKGGAVQQQQPIKAGAAAAANGK